MGQPAQCVVLKCHEPLYCGSCHFHTVRLRRSLITVHSAQGVEKRGKDRACEMHDDMMPTVAPWLVGTCCSGHVSSRVGAPFAVGFEERSLMLSPSVVVVYYSTVLNPAKRICNIEKEGGILTLSRLSSLKIPD